MNVREVLFLIATFILCNFYAFHRGRFREKRSDIIFFSGAFLIFSILESRHFWWSLVAALVLGFGFWFFPRGSMLFLWICLNFTASFLISAATLEKISFQGFNSRLFYSFPILIGILFALASIRTWKKCGLKKMKAIFTCSFSAGIFLIWGLLAVENKGVILKICIIFYSMILGVVGYFCQEKEQRIEII